MVVGCDFRSPDAGGAWVFTRSGSTWTQQGGKLVGAGHVGEGEFAHVGEGEFGTSVALSADGNTALIGAPGDDGDAGAVWVFTRSGSTWTQQGEKLAGGGESGEGRFGTSVALSGDGTTALIGGAKDENAGAAWIFARSGSTWSQQGEKLTGGGEGGEGEFGTNVALSSDGSTALIGAWRDNGGVGAAWVFAVPPGGTGGEESPQGGDETPASEAPPTPPASPAPGPGGEGLPRPELGQVRQSSRSWREGNRLAGISRAKAPTGTTFSFSLNEQATVTFSFTRRGSGRGAAGRLTFTGHRGANKVSFQGRISSAKKLKPGRYRLTITAANSAGVRASPKALSFTILPAP